MMRNEGRQRAPSIKLAYQIDQMNGDVVMFRIFYRFGSPTLMVVGVSLELRLTGLDWTAAQAIQRVV